MAYIVRWVVDLDDDCDFKGAAKQALRMQRDPESIACVFEVTDTKTGRTQIVDLLEHVEEEE